MTMSKKVWELRDIILLGLLAVVFGFIYFGIGHVMNLVAPFLAPFGLAPLSKEIFFGVWIMASTMAGYLMRKPGISTIAEVVPSLFEVLLGSLFGPMVLLSGLIQGVGVELGYAVFRYRRWDMVSVCLAAAISGIFSFIWTVARGRLDKYTIGFIVVIFIVRILSCVFFSGVVVKKIGDALRDSGVVDSYAIGQDRR